MCAIGGVVGTKDPGAAVASVRRMMSILARRGPDGEGVACWEGVVLGHRRLAIFDLSEAGRQPMISPDGRIGVVFNGAIYNYRELRDELIASGSSFRSQSDTEVLVHGYASWGVDKLVARLRGMFAFALWDDRIRTLSLVRDRLGVKPLVYAQNNGALAFASTVRALAGAGYAGEVSEDGVRNFLEAGFLADEQCIYRGVTKVPAGSIVEWASGNVSVRTYWAPRHDPVVSGITFGQAVEETKRALLDAVEVRLHADVPVGALLSGGIDSSLVCWAARTLGGEIPAYTIGTRGDPWDEAEPARETARVLGLDHRIVEMSDEDLPDTSDLVSAYAEPFASASALGMLRVSRAISQSSPVKVLLTGDGGDDAFLGYPRHRHLFVAGTLARCVPGGAARAWRRSRSLVPAVGPLRRGVALLNYATDGVSGVIEYSRRLDRLETERLLGERLRTSDSEGIARCTEHRGNFVLSDFLAHEFKTRFVGEYMTKVDGATMHYGLEARSPFLDQRIWELASSIPFGIRLRRGTLKAILRKIARDEMSAGIAGRPKRGFGIPVQRWIVGRWRPWVEELLRESILERDGWIRRGSAVGRLSAAIPAGIAPRHLWHLIVLEAWFRYDQRAEV